MININTAWEYLENRPKVSKEFLLQVIKDKKIEVKESASSSSRGLGDTTISEYKVPTCGDFCKVVKNCSAIRKAI